MIWNAQLFNAFNHPNFDNPVADKNSPPFGRIIRTVSPPTSPYRSRLGADAALELSSCERSSRSKLQVIGTQPALSAGSAASTDEKKSASTGPGAALLLCALLRDAATIRGMVSALAKRVWEEIKRQGVIGPGTRFGVAVSGGGDSVALLLLLEELSKQAGFVFCILHLNHGLRGKASDADERFVGGLAKRLDCEFHCKRVAVSRLAKSRKQNLEDAGRRERYEWFAAAAAEHHLSCVATAHTADDQAETVLAHIVRGTGLAGLSGIQARIGPVIRPLLKVRRQELREYLKERGQRWREDASNRDVRRTRARIRRALLPVLEKRFQPRVVEHLAELAERASEQEDLLSELVRGARGPFVTPVEAGCRIAARDLLNPLGAGYPWPSLRAISSRLILDLARESKAGRGQLTAGHIESVLGLAAGGENGKILELPGGLRICREHDALVFCSARALATRRVYSHPVEEFDNCCSVPVPQLQCVFRFTVIDWPSVWRDTNLTGTVLDRDRLSFPLVLRNWWPGDRIHPAGRQRSHKLKQLLSELHLSRWEREGWPVLTSEGKAAWVRGLPVAIEFAATERTQAGIVITVETAPEAVRLPDARPAQR